MSAFHDLSLRGLDGQDLPLAQFRDRVLLWWSTSPPGAA